MSKFVELAAKLDLIPHLYLGRSFDVTRLQAELDSIDPALFVEYRSKSKYTKRIAKFWHGLSLVAPGGSVHGDLTEEAYALRTDSTWTPIAQSCPYMKEVITELGGEGQRVRFMRLQPGGGLTWHRHGPEFNFQNGKVVNIRPNWFELIVHITVRSNPLVSYEVIEAPAYELDDFAAGKVKIHQKNYPEGEAWAFNGTHFHNVFNRSETEPRYSIMLTMDIRMKRFFDIVSEAVDRYLANNEGPVFERVE